MSAPRALPVISLPSRTILPSFGGSSRLMQRSSVLLPDPLGPSTHTTDPFWHPQVDAAQDVQVAEALVHALQLEHRLRHVVASPRWKRPCSRAM